jgi:hypothetical protein
MITNETYKEQVQALILTLKSIEEKTKELTNELNKADKEIGFMGAVAESISFKRERMTFAFDIMILNSSEQYVREIIQDITYMKNILNTLQYTPSVDYRFNIPNNLYDNSFSKNTGSPFKENIEETNIPTKEMTYEVSAVIFNNLNIKIDEIPLHLPAWHFILEYKKKYQPIVRKMMEHLSRSVVFNSDAVNKIVQSLFVNECCQIVLQSLQGLSGEIGYHEINYPPSITGLKDYKIEKLPTNIMLFKNF